MQRGEKVHILIVEDFMYNVFDVFFLNFRNMRKVVPNLLELRVEMRALLWPTLLKNWMFRVRFSFQKPFCPE